MQGNVLNAKIETAFQTTLDRRLTLPGKHLGELPYYSDSETAGRGSAVSELRAARSGGKCADSDGVGESEIYSPRGYFRGH